jgi:hypothetical protein
MKDLPFPVARRWWTPIIVTLAAFGPATVARGQTQAVPAITSFPTVDAQVKPIPTIPTDDGITAVGCSTCGGGGGLLSGGCSSCGSGQCSPGRRPCDCCCSTDTCLGRFINGVYQCVCCPDPCYDPQWTAIADAAFFTDAARPVTQMRFRFDHMWSMNSPDRAEYFWRKSSSAGGTGPPKVSNIDVSEFRIYTEAAAGRAGISIDIPYRRIEDEVNHSGFVDMVIGTKAMLLDCELLQISFAMDTTVPSGSPTNGLSTGHVSLEPSLLWGVKLAANTYLQAKTGLWIPIGGTPGFQGNVFDYRFSLNQILYKPCNDLQVIGTLELNGWTFLNGQRTDNLGNAVDVKSNIMAGGPGIRCVICDKLDFGIGSMFAFTNQRWAEEMIRIDFRWRF